MIGLAVSALVMFWYMAEPFAAGGDPCFEDLRSAALRPRPFGQVAMADRPFPAHQVSPYPKG